MEEFLSGVETELDDGCVESTSGLKFWEKLKIMFDGVGGVWVISMVFSGHCFYDGTLFLFFFALGLFSEEDCQFYFYLPYLS